MKKLLALVIIVVFISAASPCLGGIPHLISYQGMLTDDLGEPLNGSFDLTFRIFDDLTGGTQEWGETQYGIIVTDGLFSVNVGDSTPVDLPFDEDYWLEIEVGVYGPLSPRARIVSVGYAYRAERVDTSVYSFQAQRADTADYAISADTAAYALTGGEADADWTFRITDTADTTLVTGGPWGISRSGNVLFGTADSSHVNLGAACTTGTSGQNNKYCTVGGGWQNAASGNGATVGGGRINTASGQDATVGGGVTNTASGSYATVGGGDDNIASGSLATVGGGDGNTADSNYATVGGGTANTASGQRATVGGGGNNTASGVDATIGGGRYNTACSLYATVGGGEENTASAIDATIGGGNNNTASGYRATVGGGAQNTADSNYATIGGGDNNAASGDSATVGGGGGNTASAPATTVGGGERNTASFWFATVGGGERNTASGSRATVGGGGTNTASGHYGTVGGGTYNTASGDNATVAGGNWCIASGGTAAIGGGYNNTASGGGTAIGGGSSNVASGLYSAIPGGYADTVAGDYSFAAGGRVKISSAGDYTFAFGRNFTTATPNAVIFFNSDAEIKVGIDTTSPGNIITVKRESSTDPIADAWTTYSSIRWKEKIKPIENALDKVLALRGVYFDWKESKKHDMGMIAEEVGEVIPEVVAYEKNGEDAKSLDYARLTTLLVEAIKEQQKEIETLREEINALKEGDR